MNDEIHGIYKHWGKENKSYTEKTYVNGQEEGIEKYFNDDLLPIGVNYWVELVKNFFEK